MKSPYVYIVVRTDLTLPQQAVQSSHALLEMSRQYSTQSHQHPSIIILGVKNEEKLKDTIIRLVRHGKIQFTTFQEPDIGDEYTALATVPIYGTDRDFFKDYRLIDGTSKSK